VKKKILTLEIITILIIMILTLTGCGNKEENNNNKQNESNTEIGKLDLEVEELREFSEGLVAVKINGKWGYMDKKGNIVIDCLYESAGEFSEGLVAVQKDGKYGYINNNGDVVVDFKYRTANSFEFGYAVIRSGTYYGVIDKEGNEITLLDILKTPAPDFAIDIHNQDNIKRIDKYFAVLTDREKEIIEKRYGLNDQDKLTQKEIAKYYKISRSYVSRIEKRALTKMLREYIKNKNN